MRPKGWHGAVKQNEGGKCTQQVSCLRGTLVPFSGTKKIHYRPGNAYESKFHSPCCLWNYWFKKYLLEVETAFCTDEAFKVLLKHLAENVGWLSDACTRSVHRGPEFFSSSVSQSVQHGSNIPRVLPEACKHIRKPNAINTWAHLLLNHVWALLVTQRAGSSLGQPFSLGEVQTRKCVSIQPLVIISFTNK